jgi:hypothetical protein
VEEEKKTSRIMRPMASRGAIRKRAVRGRTIGIAGIECPFGNYVNEEKGKGEGRCRKSKNQTKWNTEERKLPVGTNSRSALTRITPLLTTVLESL